MAGQPPTDLGLGIRLIAAGLAFAFAVGVVAMAAASPADILSASATIAVVCIAIACGVGGLLSTWRGLKSRSAVVDRLRQEAVTLIGRAAAPPRSWRDPDQYGALHAPLVSAFSALLDRVADGSRRPDARLAAVLGTIEEGMIAVTSTGLISLLNGPAATLLGAEHGVVGTSAFASIERHGLEAAIDAATAGGRPVLVSLALADDSRIDARVTALPVDQGGGAVIAFTAQDLSRHGEIVHDLTLHRAPAEVRTGFDRATRLTDVPFVVLDTETTGLDVSVARVVSIGIVRQQGPVPFVDLTIDRLIHPGVPIPLASTEVHGITTAMVVNADPFLRVWQAEIAPFIEGCVWVGHNIGYDVSLLRRECERAGAAWTTPVALDTGLLYAALNPDADDTNLETVAARLAVDPRGRHTALGDALVTAEVMAKLIGWMTADGHRTLGDAQALMAQSKPLIRAHARVGWDPIVE